MVFGPRIRLGLRVGIDRSVVDRPAGFDLRVGIDRSVVDRPAGFDLCVGIDRSVVDRPAGFDRRRLMRRGVELRGCRRHQAGGLCSGVGCIAQMCGRPGPSDGTRWRTGHGRASVLAPARVRPPGGQAPVPRRLFAPFVGAARVRPPGGQAPVPGRAHLRPPRGRASVSGAGARPGRAGRLGRRFPGWLAFGRRVVGRRFRRAFGNRRRRRSDIWLARRTDDRPLHLRGRRLDLRGLRFGGGFGFGGGGFGLGSALALSASLSGGRGRSGA